MWNEPHGGAVGFPGGVAYWSKALAVETEKVVQRKREEMMQAELERYMAHAIGYRPKGRLYATTGHER